MVNLAGKTHNKYGTKIFPQYNSSCIHLFKDILMEGRVTLSKIDLSQQAGTDLLALLTKITDDGIITKNEFLELFGFLKRNLAIGIPSISYLHDLMQDIASDGIVSKEEINLLFLAIATVLPIKERKVAKDARKEIEAQRKEIEKVNMLKAALLNKEAKEKQKREKAEELAKADAERHEYESALIDKFDFIAAGSQFYSGYREIDEESILYLEREPTNSHDKNAVLIKASSGTVVGYVPKYIAEDMAPSLDANCDQLCFVKKMLASNTPVVIATLFKNGRGKRFGAIATGSRPTIPVAVAVPSDNSPTVPPPTDNQSRSIISKMLGFWK